MLCGDEWKWKVEPVVGWNFKGIAWCVCSCNWLTLGTLSVVGMRNWARAGLGTAYLCNEAVPIASENPRSGPELETDTGHKPSQPPTHRPCLCFFHFTFCAWKSRHRFWMDFIFPVLYSVFVVSDSDQHSLYFPWIFILFFLTALSRETQYEILRR